MPWTPKQHRLFEAAAHDPSIAKKTGIKQEDASRMASEGIKEEPKKKSRDQKISSMYKKKK